MSETTKEPWFIMAPLAMLKNEAFPVTTRVFMLRCLLANDEGDNWPSLKTIAKMIGIDPKRARDIARSDESLVASGAMTRNDDDVEYPGGATVASYRIAFPPGARKSAHPQETRANLRAEPRNSAHEARKSAHAHIDNLNYLKPDHSESRPSPPKAAGEESNPGKVAQEQSETLRELIPIWNAIAVPAGLKPTDELTPKRRGLFSKTKGAMDAKQWADACHAVCNGAVISLGGKKRRPDFDSLLGEIGVRLWRPPRAERLRNPPVTDALDGEVRSMRDRWLADYTAKFWANQQAA